MSNKSIDKLIEDAMRLERNVTDKLAEHARHTPGPWFFYAKYESSALVQKVQLEDAECWDDMCIECHSAVGGRPVDEANARLIAAAPELLAACRFVVNRENLMFAECSDAEEILEVCRAAIAKAEGRQ